MCGVIGIINSDKSNVISELLEGMLMLQHRGQDAAGAVTCQDNRFYSRKKPGMVDDVFTKKHINELQGNMGIGHTRYPTSGGDYETETQPFYVNSPCGIVMSHNGNLTNTDKLLKNLYESDQRHINTDSDSEILLNVFAYELGEIKKKRIDYNDIFSAVTRMHSRVNGAYATTGIIAGYAMFGFRDPHGIRPLVYGKRKNQTGKFDYMIASESVALDVLGFTLVRDVLPGETIVITKTGEFYSHACGGIKSYSPCIFELVYLARPDSWIDGISVYKAQMKMGQKLALQIPNNLLHKIDVIMPIPDTSRPIALEMAKLLKKPYREGFVKNRYVGRTFIMPTQQHRSNSVRQKLNAIKQEFEGHNVLLVDDSIVRGTTSRQIIQLARDSGAKEVYFASASPEVKFPYVYGIDLPNVYDLVAYNRTHEEICKYIGADALLYQTIEDLLDSVSDGNAGITNWDTSCFTGTYASGDINANFLITASKKMVSDNTHHHSYETH